MPFLAELARHAPQIRDDFTWMLGMLADPRHAYGEEFPAVQAAVAAQVDLLLPLLNDADQRVREAAAYAAARAGAAAGPLWRRWKVESDPAVSASLALALGHVDGPAASPVLADAAVNGPPAVRVAATVALLRAGLAWPNGTVTAVVDAIDDGATVIHGWAGPEAATTNSS
ncbi:HEAT repeat domain-containing protein [Polymorphospora sp. NPDC050346]|uniref:HEAT repeat domain-containing protein n=1 Tax=Polymorphospora sp. NPDC050346 TaxID=3155780 RepID=UPI0033C2CE9D